MSSAWLEIPKDLATLIEALESFEKQLADQLKIDPRIRRILMNSERLARHLMDKLEGRLPFVNIIPPVGLPGPCERDLLVIIGRRNDECRSRILEAIEHIGIKCRGITKNIVFYATWWDSVVWLDHEDSFKKLGVTVVLKMFQAPPLRLV